MARGPLEGVGLAMKQLPNGKMKHRYQKPHPATSAYVRTVLIVEGCYQQDVQALPLFTNGMPALLCRIKKEPGQDENIVQLTLFGKSIPPDCWMVNDNETAIAFFFQPFALASMFGIPATQLMQAPVDLGNWDPHKTNALRTQLVYAGPTDRKVEILNNLLILQLQENYRECEVIRNVTDQILCNPGAEALSEIQEKLGLQERTFQRIFKKYVGVTPNQYRRICQFHTSFAQLKAQAFDRLTDVAYDNGFADQSHFIRSFREFTQCTPNSYLRSGLKGNDE